MASCQPSSARVALLQLFSSRSTKYAYKRVHMTRFFPVLQNPCYLPKVLFPTVFSPVPHPLVTSTYNRLAHVHRCLDISLLIESRPEGEASNIASKKVNRSTIVLMVGEIVEHCSRFEDDGQWADFYDESSEEGAYAAEI